MAAVTNDHKLDILKPHKFILLQFRRSEENTLPYSLSASRDHLHSLARGPASLQPLLPSSCPFHFLWSSCLPLVPKPIWIIQKHLLISRFLIISAKSLVPWKVFTVLGIRTRTSLGAITLSTPVIITIVSQAPSLEKPHPGNVELQWNGNRIRELSTCALSVNHGSTELAWPASWTFLNLFLHLYNT